MIHSFLKYKGIPLYFGFTLVSDLTKLPNRNAPPSKSGVFFGQKMDHLSYSTHVLTRPFRRICALDAQGSVLSSALRFAAVRHAHERMRHFFGKTFTNSGFRAKTLKKMPGARIGLETKNSKDKIHLRSKKVRKNSVVVLDSMTF